jgi:hypothetical protein
MQNHFNTRKNTQNESIKEVSPPILLRPPHLQDHVLVQPQANLQDQQSIILIT